MHVNTRKKARPLKKVSADLLKLLHPAEIPNENPVIIDDIQSPKEQQLLQLLADVCVGMWRTHSKMIDPNSGEALEETMRAFRPLQSTIDILLQGGFEIKDHTNKPYVVGMLEKVVAWETVESLKSEMIIETIRPTIIYHEMVLKQGEIIVGVPPKA
jgi:hypothetical protein